MSQQYPGTPGQPQPPYQNTFQPAPPEPPKKLSTPVVVTGIVVGLVVLGGLAAINPDDKSSDKPAAQVTQTQAAAPADDAPSATADSTPAPTPVQTPLARPVPKPTPQPPKPKVTKPPQPKPVVYKKISTRQWKLIAKSPDAHVGEHLVVYGRVSQFDAATGADAFRADVDGIKRRPSYGYVDYPTNVVLTGAEAALANLVEDDLFTAKVTVTGSLTYDTQIGGETTVPQLQVASITVTGSVAD